MMDNNALNHTRRHKLYKAFFYLFVFGIVVLIFFFQPYADVPAPIIYGILLILLVDTLYYELIVRLITGKAGKGIIRSFFKKPSSVLRLGFLWTILAGAIAGFVALELGGNKFDFLIWFTVAGLIGTRRYIDSLQSRIKDLEKK